MKTALVASKERRGKLADSAHVDELIRNYKKERWLQNSDRIGKSDSLSAWYGLKELEEFLAIARKHKADGIKMYFGVYPENYDEAPEIGGRQTVVLVGTKKKQTPLGVSNKDIYVERNGKTEILAFNFSSTCPPFCGNEDGMPGIDADPIGISILEHKDGLRVL